MVVGSQELAPPGQPNPWGQVLSASAREHPAPFARDLGDDHWDREPRRRWYHESSDESDEALER